jgi:hypothetical protein
MPLIASGEQSANPNATSQPLATPQTNGNDSDSDRYSGSVITSNGLPPFRSTDTGTPPPETSNPSSVDVSQIISDEEREEAEYRAQLEQRSNELRQLLNIDYNQLYEPGAWEELVRYKGVKCM